MRAIRAIRTLLLATLVSIIPAPSFAGIFLSVTIAPPVLPVYAQPVCPGDGYLWTPGYWAYGEEGYFWVPGTWVLAPRPGYLWTPGYWGWGEGAYLWHSGYWGPHVGFYGGVNYGYGYGGEGFYGGRWEGEHFRYNAAVLHVDNRVVHNTYIDRTVINNTTIINRTSYNGPGGINARPRPGDQVAVHDQHVQPTSEQMSHERFSAANRANFASVNGGRPAMAAVPRPITSQAMATQSVSKSPAFGSNSRPGGNQNQINNAARPQANAGYQQPANNTRPAFGQTQPNAGGRPAYQQPVNNNRPQASPAYQQPVNNNRPAYGQAQPNNGFHPTYQQPANNNRPQASPMYQQPANNGYHPSAGNDARSTAAPRSPEPMHQGAAPQPHFEQPHQNPGGGQPHNEPHQGGGERR